MSPEQPQEPFNEGETDPANDHDNLGEKPPRARRKRATLKTSFLTGLVIAAPIGITIWLTWSFVSFVDSRVQPLVFQITPATWHGFIDRYDAIPGLGLLLVVLSLTVLGMLTANIVGRTVVGWGDSIWHRMPVIGTVYKTLKQIFETVVSQADPSFQDVCMIEYPRKGIWAVGFVTAETKGEIQARADLDLVTVFMPTTPNPTSGFLLFVPRKDVKILDMTVEEGAKLVISAGIVTPDFIPPVYAGAGNVPEPVKAQSLLERFTRRNNQGAA